MSTIINRVVSSVQDQRILLANSNFARPHGVATWNKLRLGVRLVGNGTASISGSPQLAIGFCSGTSGLFLDLSCTHFVGMVTTGGWAYNQAGPPTPPVPNNWVGNPFFKSATKIGSTLTVHSGFFSGASTAISADPLGLRGLYMIDIERGSPNYTMEVFLRVGYESQHDTSVEDLLTQIISTSPVLPDHLFNYSGSPVSFPVDEIGAGTLDCVTVAWDQVFSTIEVCDIAVARLA